MLEDRIANAVLLVDRIWTRFRTLGCRVTDGNTVVLLFAVLVVAVVGSVVLGVSCSGSQRLGSIIGQTFGRELDISHLPLLSNHTEA